MIYSPRLKKILEILLQQDDYMAMDTLAQTMKISRRTLFRELSDIDLQLKPYDVRFVSRNGLGIRLEGSVEHKEILRMELDTKEIQYMNKEERRNLLIFEVLRNENVEKLIHYANMFQVSEATISNDLDYSEEWLAPYAITLLRKPGIGVEVKGVEENRRRAMTAIVNETLRKSSEYVGVNYLDSQLLLEQIFLKAEKDSIMKLLNQEILERILIVFHRYQHEFSLDTYAQTSYIGLIIHLVIAIERILHEEELEDNDSVLEMVQDNVAYATAQKMAAVLETEFDIQIPQGEIAFIALHIKGAKITYLRNLEDVQKDTLELHEVIKEMIESYDVDIRCQLLQDEQFLQGLITHLEPTITRLQHHLPIYNPLLIDLKKQYDTLFQQTRIACQYLEKRYQCKVSEDEIGFLTMHVGASLERMQHALRHRSVEVGVVCASGIGVSALLSARIAKAFHGDVILHTLSMDAINQQKLEHIELLVSTFPIQDLHLPFLQVSPLLNDEDLLQIRQEVKRLQQQPKKHLPVQVGIDFEEQLLQMHRVSEACLEVLHNISLHTLVHTSCMKDVIRKVSSSLTKDEVLQSEIEKRLTQREQLGSIILHEYGIALLHARAQYLPECKVALFYPTLPFVGELENIDVILVLLMKEKHTSQQQAVMSLISRSLLESSSFLASLKEGKEDAIRKEIQYLLKQYVYNEE